ncbi:heavy metal translocating P-type ATPase [Vibrio aestuarianus]|uniref:Copper-exporting P-type ATPase n=1 Tax=Vibrio aestuarianus TaxID=28171 RepID=A0ABD7YIB7_9VIBR|nr:heavy metal translocating P-type ATPase [Vibrio aestuarianus]WGK84663.1 heavy metal translocating P-type ATPase [Vibrio aestuarianus]CAH8216864.1 Copper-exporting P-type ATPase A [Vibrio aestuarianus]
MKHFSIPLAGLKCMGCAKKIERQLKQQANVDIHLLTTTLIELTTSASLDELIDEIESLGYQAGNHLEFELQGLNCGGCVNKLTSLLKASDQITRLLVTKTQLSLVTTLPAASIQQQVASLGYQALIEEENREAEQQSAPTAVDNTNLPKQPDMLENFSTVSIHLQIQGMTCASCVSSVEKALLAVKGVKRAQINLAEQSALVATSSQNEALVQQLLKNVKEAGYRAEKMDDPALQQQKQQQHLQETLKHHQRSAWLGLMLGIPLMGWGVAGGNMMILSTLDQWLWGMIGLLCLGLLATAGRQFFSNAWLALTHRRATMDTLVALGTGAAWIYSMLVIIVPNWFPLASRHVYFEASAMIIGLISLGHYIEAKAKAKTTQSLQALINLQPQQATLITEQGDKTIDVGTIQLGMKLRIKPGEKAPIDGKVLVGESYLDESMLTGEPIPVLKTKGDGISAGTINNDGSLIIEATGIGAQTMLARIIQMVRQAQSSKPAIAKLADQISAIFVPIVVLIALFSAFTWYLFGPDPKASYMLVVATTVLIIACPCALGLATPLSVTVGVGKAAEMGILIRDADVLQSASKITTVVFDKTGTLTQGKPSVQSVDTFEIDKQRLLSIAYSIEQHSDHPLAKAVCQFAQQHAIQPLSIEQFANLRGKGLSANVQGERITIASIAHIQSLGISLAPVDETIKRYATKAWTPMIIIIDDQIKGMIAIADPIKEEAAQAISALTKLGIHTVMLTGDTQSVANAIAKQLGIKQVIAQVLPAQKAQHINKLQKQGQVVAMVGDGINDAPALAKADIGMAMGSGSDVAIESAQMTLLNSSPLAVVNAIALSKATIKNMKQNLLGAFVYNSLGIPIAAGILYPAFGFLLSPVVAGAAMALSSITVVSNANRLRLFKTPFISQR